jgi:hypothetical protein
MKTLASLALVAAFGSLQAISPSPSTPICLVGDCCGAHDVTRTDSINGPFTTVCDLLTGPEIDRPIF